MSIASTNLFPLSSPSLLPLLPSILKNYTITSGCVFFFVGKFGPSSTETPLTMLCASSIAGNLYILLYYLPIYFQAVKGTDAAESEIRTVSLILVLGK